MRQGFNDGSFAVGSSDLFDATAHTQGGLPHLVQFLWDEYAKHLDRLLTERKEAGKPVTDLQTAKTKAPAVHFAKWASDYLKENRIVESFFIDGNLGIRLTNMKMVAVCPGLDEIRGTMQDSHAVGITHGRSQADNNGVIDESDRSFRI
jgi:hypothetical protein